MEGFTRLEGAQADLNELLYISALMQTGKDLRLNGTVSSLDIQRHLMSRYNIFISHPQAIEVVRSLGGGRSQEEVRKKKQMQAKYKKMVDNVLKRAKNITRVVRGSANEDQREGSIAESVQEEQQEEEELETAADTEEYLDIVQLTSILLIPTLARAGKEFRDGTDDRSNHQDDIHNASDTGWYERWKSEKVQHKQDKELLDKESLRPQPHTLIKDVLGIILSEVYYDEADWPPLLTEDLVEGILLEYGEIERAQDKELIREMVRVAASSSGRMDEAAFANCLTLDTGEWEVGSEDRKSSFYYDIFRIDKANGVLENVDESVNEESGETMQLLDTENALDNTNIDFVIDAHTSTLVTILIWTFYVVTALSYATLLQGWYSEPCGNMDNSDNTGKAFGCNIAKTLWSWFCLALTLTLFGLIMVIPLSVGNNPNNRSSKRLLCTLLFCIFYTFVPFALVNNFETRVDCNNVKNEAEHRVCGPFWTAIQRINLFLGCMLCLVYFLQLFTSIRGEIFQTSKRKFEPFLVTSNTTGEWRIKRATTRKINKLIMNAHKLHDLNEKEFQSFRSNAALASKTTSAPGALNGNERLSEKTMLNFLLKGLEEVKTGGLCWTWSRVFNRELFDTEGIWIPTRIHVFQAAQVTIFLFISFALIHINIYAANQADIAQKSLESIKNAPQWVIDIVPTRRQANFALYPAAGIAIGMMVIIMAVYIPSATATILSYRCGRIPSLNSPYFKPYRIGADKAYMNIGNAIYGMTGSALLFYAIVGLVIFLFIWDFSQPLMIQLLAWGIGLGITIGLKMILTKTCESTMFKSFYRIKPRQANLSTLALECWFIGLGASVLIGRITQFLAAAVFWVGRIDVPFLSSDVSLFGYSFDYVPTNFMKDILIHEAHRHPYVERLAQLYLMHLKSNRFGCEACSVWRQLFVTALMPWIQKYRVYSKVRLSQAMDAFSRQLIETKEDQMGLADHIKEDMHVLIDNVNEAGDHVIDDAKHAQETAFQVAEDAAGTTLQVAEKTTGVTMDLMNELAFRKTD